MSKAKHHAPVEHRSHHAEKVEAPVVEEPVLGEMPLAVVELPGVVVDVPPEPEAPTEELTTPRETTLADHFDCACGPKRNLSMEAGVYKCHGCGHKEHAQTLESRKAAGR